MQSKTRGKAVAIAAMNVDIVKMLSCCVEICREGGRRYARAAFDEFVNYMGYRLGLTSDKPSLSTETLEKLKATLDFGKLAARVGDHLGMVASRLEVLNDRLGQCLTPPNIADFMNEIVGVDSARVGQRIFDPALGTGVFLISAAKTATPGVELWGVEIDPSLYRAALVQLNIYTAFGIINPFRVVVGDSLTNDIDWSKANRWRAKN